MATRSSKFFSPSSFLRKAKQRLTGRMACFVWGAVFGNAVLTQPINPLDLLLEPPENLLSGAYRNLLDTARSEIRQLGMRLKDQALDTVRQQSDSVERPRSALPLAPSGGDFADCAEQFPAQQPLQTQTVSSQWAPQALCSASFAVLYSGLTRTPMVVVEKLNRQRLSQASGLERTDRFYADERVPSGQRAELSDYLGSGYDRGHMSAAANQPSSQAMAESFALSNMVPQDPTNNRKIWAKLEADVRKYALRAAGDVYVFSGPLHQDGTPKKVGRNSLWVPSHLFKLVYDAAGERAWAYVLPNSASAQISRPIDYASFVQQTQWKLLEGQTIVGSLR